MHIHTAVAVEGRDTAVLLEPVLVGGALDEADRLEARGLPRLGFEPRIEIARVFPELGRGLGGGAERHHEAGRVPGGAGGELVSLEEHDVATAHVREVIRDRAADHASADDDDARVCGNLLGGLRRGAGLRIGDRHERPLRFACLMLRAQSADDQTPRRSPPLTTPTARAVPRCGSRPPRRQARHRACASRAVRRPPAT